MNTGNGHARQRYRPGVFLSYPKPCHLNQEAFIDRVCQDLEDRGLAPRTLGVTDYSTDAPLEAIRQIMSDSNGLVTIAFRRYHLSAAVGNYQTDIPDRSSYDLGGQWMTSPWSHIEPAMAYQIGLPILIFREKGVYADGVLERGVAGLYMPEFDASCPLDDYFTSNEWTSLISQWEGQVKNVVTNKGRVNRLY